MAGDTLTFEMGGRVEIGQLERGIARFRRLVSELSRETGVNWVVEDLHPGSAVITLKGESDTPSKVEKIVGDYDSIGKALELQEPLQFDAGTIRAAEAIKSLASSFEYIRLETPNSDYTIFGNGGARTGRTLSVSIGAISGRVQTLSNRGSLRFNLYDTVHDRPVSCYLQPGQEELMREAWGQRSRVSGSVSRERDSGRPVAIRQILKIEILEDVPPGSYLLAKGAVPWQPGDEMPEDTIRRLRDA